MRVCVCVSVCVYLCLNSRKLAVWVLELLLSLVLPRQGKVLATLQDGIIACSLCMYVCACVAVVCVFVYVRSVLS